MEGQQYISVKTRLTQKVSSLSLGKDELKKLCDILQERSDRAAELEIQAFTQREQSDEQYEKNKKELKECFILHPIIVGDNGEQLTGSIENVFNSPNYPEDVKSFFVDSEGMLRAVHNYYPRNLFKVFLDFSKPKILDFSLKPAQETPNDSNFEVQGFDTTWANGVFNEIGNYFKRKSTKLSVVHRQNVYDLLLFLLGFPLAFWACLKASTIIEGLFANFNSLVRNAAYLYIFIATLIGFRILFHYLRWVSPLVEYHSSQNTIMVHRTVLAALSIGVFGAFIYDIIKFIF